MYFLFTRSILPVWAELMNKSDFRVDSQKLIRNLFTFVGGQLE